MSKFYFTNGNLIIPINVALSNQYSLGDIADLLEVPVQEVFNQHNSIIKLRGF